MFVYQCIIKPRSHIACNWSATSLRPKFRVVTGRLQGGCKEVGVAEGCRDDLVARRFWLLQVTKSILERFLVVADWLATDRRPVAVVADNPDTVFSRRLIADQSPIGYRPISKKLQNFCNQKQTLKIQSPTSRRPIANQLAIAPQLIADWLPTDCRRVDNHCPIRRHYNINTRSLRAPGPMLDLFSVSYSDMNLKAILWRQFYKRYFKHRSL